MSDQGTVLPQGEVLAAKYRIVGVLGRGGSSVTYEAERLADGVRVAIKELRLSRLDDWKVLELFEREARVLANITHPAIPAYVDQFSIERPEGPEGPVFYLVQQLAPGRSLADRVASGWRADEVEVKRIAEVLLDILDYLHSRLPAVYHRDLKPQNIVREDSGKVWLVDFGAVRDIHRTTSGGSTVAGTFGYMAPEQLHGVARAESDLYALGAALLFLMTGRAPAEMPHRKLKIDFRGQVHISPPLAAWLDRMLEPAPEDRFHSARQALAALRDPSILAPPRSARRTTAVLAGVLGVLVAVAAAVGIVELRGRATLRAQTRAGMASLPARPWTYQADLVRFTRTIPAHFNVVISATYTPDAALLLTASFDQTAKIWDAHTGQAIRALPGHTGKVGAVRVTPDGHLAVTAGDHTLRLWSLPDGKSVRVIDADPQQVFTADVSPNGTVLASGNTNGQAKLWTIQGAPLATLAHGGPRVLSVAFTPDGSRVVTAGDDPAIKVWSVPDGKLLCTLKGHTKAVSEVAIAPDGQIVASGSDDHLVKVWHVGTCREMATLNLFTDEVWGLAFSPDGSMLVAGGKEPTLGVWDMPTTKLRQSIPLGDAAKGTMAVVFAPGGESLVTTHGGGIVYQWSVAHGGKHAPLPVPTIGSNDPPANATPDQRTYAAAMDLVESYGGDSRVLDQAQSILRGMLQKDPRSAPAYAGLGRVAFKRAFRSRDDYDAALLSEALHAADQAIVLDGTFPDGFIVRGSVLLDQKDLPGARAAVDAALKLTPTAPRAMSLLANVEIANGDLTAGEKTLRDMMTRPLSRRMASSSFAILADLYEREGDMDGAGEARRREIDTDPDSAWAKGNYAAFLLRKGDYDGAIASARAAQAQMRYGAVARTLADAYCAKATVLLWDHNDASAARAAFDEAARADPGASCAPYGLGACEQNVAVTHGEMARFGSAKTFYERAFALDPKNSLAKNAADALR